MKPIIFFSISALVEISKLLNTGLDPESLAICVKLCEAGVNPEALASVVQELRREAASLQVWETTDAFISVVSFWRNCFSCPHLAI